MTPYYVVYFDHSKRIDVRHGELIALRGFVISNLAFKSHGLTAALFHKLANAEAYFTYEKAKALADKHTEESYGSGSIYRVRKVKGRL